MKKLSLVLLVITSLFSTSCRLSTISNINSGVKVLTKCCNEISGVGSKGCKYIESNEKILEENTSSKGLLPTYSWDPKQMLW